MERLNETRSFGLGGRGLKLWGLVFLAVGAVGRGLLQNRLLGVGTMTGQELLELMQSSQSAMLFASFSLILQAAEVIAVPIFAFLLAQRMTLTEAPMKLLLWLLGLAVLSQVPYNLAMEGKVLNFGDLNPAFGLTLSAAMLVFYRLYGEKTMAHRTVRVVVTAAAVLWTLMLRIEHGTLLVLLTCICYCLKKPVARNLTGALAGVACMMASPFYVAAPMGFLPVHLYNGEPEEERFVNYLPYPALLLVIAAIGTLM